MKDMLEAIENLGCDIMSVWHGFNCQRRKFLSRKAEKTMHVEGSFGSR